MTRMAIIVLLCAGVTLHAQQHGRWIKPTAFADSTGVHQIGLLSDGRAGLGGDMTMYAHPVMVFLAPTAELQVTWLHNDSEALASYHRLSSPTPLMLLFQMEGDLGMVTPEASVGFLLGITNGIRWSTAALDGMVTMQAGVEIGIGDPDPRTSVDLPMLYPRMLAYYDTWVAELGVVYERGLGAHFGLTVEAASFFNAQDLFLEFTPRLSWHIGEHWSLHVDPVITYGTYPYGNDWQLIILPDLTYRW